MPSKFGARMLAAASVAGLVIAAIAYAERGSGVDGTGGALLVVASTALLSAAGFVLAFERRARSGVSGVLTALALLGVLGTAVAAWFLHEWALVGVMALAAAGWAAMVAGRGAHRAAA